MTSDGGSPAPPGSLSSAALSLSKEAKEDGDPASWIASSPRRGGGAPLNDKLSQYREDQVCKLLRWGHAKVALAGRSAGTALWYVRPILFGVRELTVLVHRFGAFGSADDCRSLRRWTRGLGVDRASKFAPSHRVPGLDPLGCQPIGHLKRHIARLDRPSRVYSQHGQVAVTRLWNVSG